MRGVLTAVLVVGLSAAVAAQSAAHRSRPFISQPTMALPLPTIGLPLPTIGLPLPSIGLPLSRIGLPPIEPSPAHARPHRGTNASGSAPTTDRQHSQFGSRARRSSATVIYFVPAYGLDYPQTPGLPFKSSEGEQWTPPTGSLRLELQPGLVPQVYVDGYYVGTLNDVNAELPLDVGRHRLELRADGYENLELDVQIFPGRSTTYRGTLKAVEPVSVPVPEIPAPTQVSPRAPATIYFIPGCYLGDVPPNDARLPAGCDASDAITFKN